eukprot:TRINITY_DN11943_c0_g1_i1.p1 TRINITY_DN11943_c0_g1~~TRINITY_DN11943_c0_g1_i1.p1  ORF type:complete len:2064 (-),score=446.14 TRINITY_DN11943_c0_g1_i1:9-5495(-)
MTESAYELRNDPEVGHEALLLQTAAKSLLVLSNNVLDVSALEAGALRIEADDFDLRKLLQALVPSTEFAAQQKGIKFQLLMAENLPTMVSGDGLRVQQLLYNLISNAVRFTSTGAVTVRARVSAAADDEDDRTFVDFRIEDTGCCIPGEAGASLFAKVQESSGSGGVARTALGLYITKKLVKKMHGRISLASKKNRSGTIVQVQIPFERATHHLPAMLPTTATRNLRILYADDEPANHFVLHTHLHASGHTLMTVDNGLQAVEAFKTEKPDLLLLDVDMPVMDGVQALQEIRNYEQLSKCARTPMAFLTAHATPEFAKLDVDHVIPKPISRAWLLQYVTGIADGLEHPDRPMTIPTPKRVKRSSTSTEGRSTGGTASHSGGSDSSQHSRTPSSPGTPRSQDSASTPALHSTPGSGAGTPRSGTPITHSSFDSTHGGSALPRGGTRIARDRALQVVIPGSYRPQTFREGVAVMMEQWFSLDRHADAMLQWRFNVMRVAAMVVMVLFFVGFARPLPPLARLGNFVICLLMVLYVPVMRTQNNTLLHRYTVVQTVLTIVITLSTNVVGVHALQYDSCFAPFVTMMTGAHSKTVKHASIASVVTATAMLLILPIVPLTAEMQLLYIRESAILHCIIIAGMTFVALRSDSARALACKSLAQSVEAIARVQRRTQVKRDASEQFATSVAYDFRTPLSIVMGMAEAIMEAPSLPPKLSRHMHVLQSACQLLLNMMHNILDSRSMDSGSELAKQLSVFSVREVVRQTARMMCFQARAKCIYLRVQIANSVPQCISDDSGRLQQVLVNLLGNAIRYSSTDTVLLRVDVVNAGANAHVTDTPGADTILYGRAGDEDGTVERNIAFVPLPHENTPVQADQALLRFSVLDSSFSAHEHLTVPTAPHGVILPSAAGAMGMAISEAVIQKLGGTIGSAGTVRGLRASFALPVTTADTCMLEEANVFKQWARALSILVIDDMFEMQYIMRLFLRDTPHVLTPAFTAASGLSLYQQFPHDVVIISLTISDMGWLETVRYIRARARGQCHVIALASVPTPELRAATERGEVNYFEMRPVPRQRLANILMEISQRIRKTTAPDLTSLKRTPSRDRLMEELALRLPERLALTALDLAAYEGNELYTMSQYMSSDDTDADGAVKFAAGATEIVDSTASTTEGWTAMATGAQTGAGETPWQSKFPTPTPSAPFSRQLSRPGSPTARVGRSSEMPTVGSRAAMFASTVNLADAATPEKLVPQPSTALVPNDMFEYVRDQFLPLLVGYAADMYKAFRDGEIVTLRQFAHKITGTAGSFGLYAVGVLSKRITAICHTQPFDPLALEQCIRALGATVYMTGLQQLPPETSAANSATVSGSVVSPSSPIAALAGYRTYTSAQFTPAASVSTSALPSTRASRMGSIKPSSRVSDNSGIITTSDVTTPLGVTVPATTAVTPQQTSPLMSPSKPLSGVSAFRPVVPRTFARVPQDMYEYAKTSYVPSLHAYAADMLKAATSDDILTVRGFAHKITGTAGTFGLDHITVLSKSVTAICHAQPFIAETLRQRLLELQATITATRLKCVDEDGGSVPMTPETASPIASYPASTSVSPTTTTSAIAAALLVPHTPQQLTAATGIAEVPTPKSQPPGQTTVGTPTSTSVMTPPKPHAIVKPAKVVAIVPHDMFEYAQQSYVPSLQAYAVDMLKAAAVDDIVTVRGLAHKITGTAGTFGLEVVEALSKRVTSVCHAQPFVPGTLRDCLLQLQSILQNIELVSGPSEDDEAEAPAPAVVQPARPAPVHVVPSLSAASSMASLNAIKPVAAHSMAGAAVALLLPADQRPPLPLVTTPKLNTMHRQ